jgi:hypothetical protein
MFIVSVATLHVVPCGRGAEAELRIPGRGAPVF